jgi:hypothetical protein
VNVWQWIVRSTDLLGGSLDLNWSNAQAFCQKERLRKTSRVRTLGLRAEVWLRRLPLSKQGCKILNRNAQSKLIWKQLSETRNYLCYMQVKFHAACIRTTYLTSLSPMYLYAILFCQINLNGQWRKCDIVRFLFPVLIYWCIRTYYVAYCITAYPRREVFGGTTNLFIANTARYRHI